MQIARIIPDRPADIIAEQTFVTTGAQPPLAFNVAYDPNKIDQRDTYTLQANISLNGQVRYGTTSIIPVITRGAPTQNVAVTLTSRSLPNTSGGASPLLGAGILLVGAIAIFALRRLSAAAVASY
ncbi:YbaY family lipoprotein [Candidatus Chloroploca sp. M-50]|uniref:YbaY family lipoprotein n=1 Tax=Candidatus Chloroploca mongolica TaxID=2528176 RepID=A0ABS4DFQ7_9CHLR|nr:YbaY family lipoprotein [Candidatus Chloroploca mongolica]